ncbi:MAG: hypothetical protein DRH56_04460 [Deltaproteobacteria bacterium]|nr:MAG: hypothetical protein DRH56_04460 [Deltaproteobacteria bacterium]
MAREITEKGNSARVPLWRGNAMRRCLVISLALHACLLWGIQKTVPINWFPRPLRIYHVEILRPPVDPLADDETASGGLTTRVRPEPEAKPEPAEDTISLDTRDRRYTSYAKVVKERLMARWKYPAEARENLIEGSVRILFTLDRQGRLRDIRILNGSTYAILDRETLRTIRAAAPFPPFPGSVTVRRLHIKARFLYRLTTPP